jgi:hypothetical protein
MYLDKTASPTIHIMYSRTSAIIIRLFIRQDMLLYQLGSHRMLLEVPLPTQQM